VEEEPVDSICNSILMEDENMPLNRCPSHHHVNNDMDSGIDEYPNTTESRCRWQWISSKILVNIPYDICDFAEQTKGEHNNHHMLFYRGT
jgi:hypothetical protein